MKIIYLLLLANFVLSDTFKSWEANFEFSHHEFGKFKMKRSFEVNGDNVTSSFTLRPLLIFEYSQKSDLIIKNGELVNSFKTFVKNNVPGDHPKLFTVVFSEGFITSKELDFSIETNDRILDQLGSDLQMRINAKKGIGSYYLNVINNDKGNVVERKYQVLGNEFIETPFGSYETIKVSATSTDSSTIIYFLAPDLDYFVIQSYVELKNGKRNILKVTEMPRFLEE